MGLMKRWAMELGLFDAPDDDGYEFDRHVHWICEATGFVPHGTAFLDPDSGEMVSWDEAESQARLMDDPAWQAEQKADAAAEWCGENQEGRQP